MLRRYFHGWNVVAATFVMAMFSFGLGFYGLTVYVATLQRLHGWSAATVSSPVTVYYVAGALLTTLISDRVRPRCGPRIVVTAGTVAMATGVAALGVVTATVAALSGVRRHVGGLGRDERRRDQHHAGAVVGASPRAWRSASPSMGPRWAGSRRADAHSADRRSRLRAGADDRRAGAARRDGGIATVVLRGSPAALGVAPDGDPVATGPTARSEGGASRGRGDALRTWRFWSVSAPFALGLAAQVGVLTHLVPLVTPTLGAAAPGGRSARPRPPPSSDAWPPASSSIA